MVDDDKLSALTKDSKGNRKDAKKEPDTKKESDPKKELVLEWQKDLANQVRIFGFISPEFASKRIVSKSGLFSKMVDGSIWSIKISGGPHGKPPSAETSLVAPPPSKSSSASFDLVFFSTADDLQKFSTSQLRALTSMSGLTVDDMSIATNAILDWQDYWLERFRQTVGKHGLIKGNTNQTQFSDSALVGTTAWSAFQEAAMSDEGLASLMKVSIKQWTAAQHCKGSCNNERPHEKASYPQASVLLMIHCPNPSCAQTGCTETHCFECNQIPFVKATRVQTGSFKDFCDKHPSMSPKEAEEKFKKEYPAKPSYHENKGVKPPRAKFQDYMDTHQGELHPPTKWK